MKVISNVLSNAVGITAWVLIAGSVAGIVFSLGSFAAFLVFFVRYAFPGFALSGEIRDKRAGAAIFTAVLFGGILFMTCICIAALLYLLLPD